MWHSELCQSMFSIVTITIQILGIFRILINWHFYNALELKLLRAPNF